MIANLPLEIPDGESLRSLREEIGLSQNELADELGFKESGADVIRAWEKGVRNGAQCRPTPLAWRCFRMLVVSVRAVKLDEAGLIKSYLRVNLSARLQ